MKLCIAATAAFIALALRGAGVAHADVCLVNPNATICTTTTDCGGVSVRADGPPGGHQSIGVCLPTVG